MRRNPSGSKKLWAIAILLFTSITIIGLANSGDSTNPSSTTKTPYEWLDELQAPEVTTAPPATTTPPPTYVQPRADRSYVLGVLYGKVPRMDTGNDDRVVELLQATCNLITSTGGNNFPLVLSTLIETGSPFDIGQYEAIYINAAAIALLCPEWRVASLTAFDDSK